MSSCGDGMFVGGFRGPRDLAWPGRRWLFHVPAKPSDCNKHVEVSDSFMLKGPDGIHCSVCARARILSPRGRLAEGGGAMLPGPEERTMLW